ncbi:hypothetical protein CsSME_00029899 [Camellia sinensis var. sinensis]
MRQFNHFSHRHLLNFIKVGEEDEIICSGCELNLPGSATYSCTKSNCSFTIHASCFELPHRIRHRSHPKHPLILLSPPPYSDDEFSCDVNLVLLLHTIAVHIVLIFMLVVLHCLRVKIVMIMNSCLPSFFLSQKEEQELIFICDVCHCLVAKNCWIYYCKVCNYGTHLDCVTAQECLDEE